MTVGDVQAQQGGLEAHSGLLLVVLGHLLCRAFVSISCSCVVVFMSREITDCLNDVVSDV